MVHANEEEPQATPKAAFAALFRLSASEITLRIRLEDGRVGLDLKHDGHWHPLGPLDVLEFIAPNGSADAVTMRIDDVADLSGQPRYKAWGRTDSGSNGAEWIHEDGYLSCKLAIPPTPSELNWIKFTIGAVPIDPGTTEPIPFDPIAIVRKEG